MTDENSDQNEFLEQAKRLVEKIGAKLGHDSIKETKQLDKRNLAVIIWEATNNSAILDFRSNNYDTAYLVWRDKQGELKSRAIRDTQNTKNFIYIKNITENGESIYLKLGYTDPNYRGKFKDKRGTIYRLKKEDYFGNGNSK